MPPPLPDHNPSLSVCGQITSVTDKEAIDCWDEPAPAERKHAEVWNTECHL